MLASAGVVLATLVVQGLSLAPLVKFLGLDNDTDLSTELARTRAAMATAALETFAQETGPAAQHWRFALEARQTAANPEAPCV